MLNIVVHTQMDSWLDYLEKIAGIITTCVTIGTLIFALKEYKYRKTQNVTLSVLEQISFFREKILTKSEEFIAKIRDKDATYVLDRIPIDKYNLKDIGIAYETERQKQFDTIKIFDTLSLQSQILNMLEEFAQKVIHFDTINHPALNCVKPVFVELVEINTLVLFMQRDIITGNGIYSEILELYKIWSIGIDRSSAEERTKKAIADLI